MASNSKKVAYTMRYYKVLWPEIDGIPSLATVLERIRERQAEDVKLKRPPEECINLVRRGIGVSPIWLQFLARKSGLYEGNFALSDGRLAPKVGRPGEPHTYVSLGDGEGVVDDASFIYWPEKAVMLLQSSHIMYLRRIEKYLALIAGIGENRVELLPVSKPGAMRKFNGLTYYRRVRIKLAEMDGAAYQGNNKLLKNVFKAAGESGADTVHVELGLRQGAKKDATIDGGYAREVVSAVFDDEDALKHIQSLEAWGKDTINEKQELIDLVADVFRDNGSLEADEDKTIRHERRMKMLWASFEKNKAGLDAAIR